MPLQSARTIDGENQWTTPIQILGWFNLIVAKDVEGTTFGTLGGTTVTVQRSYDAVNYYDVDRFTSTSQDVGFEPDLMWYTVGVKTGEYVLDCYVGLGVLGSMRS